MKSRMFLMGTIARAAAAACLVLAFGPASTGWADLVAYWALDDNQATTTLLNGVNTAYNGALTGSTTGTQHVAGKVGGAINMANTYYGVVSNPTALIDGLTGNYTISLWARDYGGGGDDMLLSFGRYVAGSINDRQEFELYTSALTVYDSSNGLTQSVAQAWTSGQWYHLVLTRSGGTLHMYRGGTELSLATGGSGYRTLSTIGEHYVSIGGLAGYGGAFYGSLDDLALWSEALSNPEIAAIANLGNSALNYSASQANELFLAFDAQTTATVGGKTWYYQPSGLGGGAGAVTDLGGGNWSLNLGGGAGMTTTPEPSAVVLLASGLFGLMACAWRKRK